MSIASLQLLILILRLVGTAAFITVIVLAARQANKLGENALLWGLAAAAAYLVPNMLIKRIAHYLFDGVTQNFAILVAEIFSYHVLSLLAGLLGVYVLRKVYLARSSRNPSTGENRAFSADD